LEFFILATKLKLEVLMKDYIIVFITASNQREAKQIAQHLVEEKLAACVNVIPGITSIYRWKGKIERSQESLLVVKTKNSLWPDLVRQVRKEHSYNTPEIIALPIVKGWKPYLDWLDISIRQGKFK